MNNNNEFHFSDFLQISGVVFLGLIVIVSLIFFSEWIGGLWKEIQKAARNDRYKTEVERLTILLGEQDNKVLQLQQELIMIREGQPYR